MYVCIYMYIYIYYVYTHMCVCIYIYIYRERERDLLKGTVEMGMPQRCTRRGVHAVAMF